MKRNWGIALLILLLGVFVIGCGGDKPPVVQETPRGDRSGGEEMDDASPGGDAGTGRTTLESSDVQDRFYTIYFDFDKYNIRGDQRANLEANGRTLQEESDLRVLIEGHCDERGTDEYNLNLGDKRANAIRDYLMRLGIEGSRISTISYGEERPADPGHNESAWSKNRRGVFVIQ